MILISIKSLIKSNNIYRWSIKNYSLSIIFTSNKKVSIMRLTHGILTFVNSNITKIRTSRDIITIVGLLNNNFNEL